MIKRPRIPCILISLLLQLVTPAVAANISAQAAKGREQSQKGTQRQGTLRVEQGYISTDDGTRLFYQKVGRGLQTVIIPSALFLFEDLKQLASERTLIFYDMRGRGRSEAIPDDRKAATLGIHHDVKDVERVRKHFKVEKFSLFGYSYLGLMVVMYAMDHPAQVERIVQMGPVPLKFGTEYPEHLTNRDKLSEIGAGSAAVASVNKMLAEGYDKSNPKDYCEKEWQVMRFGLVGNPANVGKLGKSLCHLPNEWPANLDKHFEHSFASVQHLDIPKQEVAQVSIPVLTIHGTKDRNAAYGAGREWALILPNARLLTVKGAAHNPLVEYPEVIMSAIRVFLGGSWPNGAEKVTPE